MSAGELESVLTVSLEDALLALPDVVDTKATTRDGLVLIVVEASSLAQAGAAWTSVEDRLARMRSELAEAFIGLEGPLLHRPSEQWAEALVAVTSTDAAGAAPMAAARQLADELAAADSVAHVEIVGRPREQIVLTYDDDEFTNAGTTPLEFREYLRGQHITAPGAYLQGGGMIQPVETRARIRSIEELRQLPVRDPSDGDPVNLSRLLDVSRVPISPNVEHVRSGGRAAIALAVQRKRGASLDVFAADVERVLAHASEQGSVAEIVAFQPQVVRTEIDRFDSNLVQTFVVILVLLVAVLGLRTGLSVALIVPLVVLATFIVMLAGGIGLDVVTLSSVILVLGLLVDNHIVMAERIHRLQEQGVERAAAISKSRRELIGPLLAAAATTAFGFLPIVLTHEPIGEYVGGLFWVVVTALIVSLVLCFVVTPALQPIRRGLHEVGALETRYRAVLARTSRFAGVLALAAVLLCVGGAMMLMSHERIFFPASSQPLWTLEIDAPQDRDTEVVAALVGDLERHLAEETSRADTPLRRWLSFAGRSAPAIQASMPTRAFAPHYAHVLLQVDPDVASEEFAVRLTAWADEHDDAATIRFHPVQLGAQLEWPVQFEVRGPAESVSAVAHHVVAEFDAAGGVHTSTDWGAPIEKLRVVPDRAALAERDLTVGDVTLGMHSVVHGLPLFTLLEEDGQIPVMLKASVKRDDPREALSDAYVYPRKGDPALLYEVAEITSTREAPALVRRRGLPAITVRADAADDAAALALEQTLNERLDGLRAEHSDVTIEAVGISASASRAQRAILDQAPWALLLILLCLLAQSRSVLDTTLTLLTIPLSFAGVALGLQLFGEAFSFMTLIGMTALAGIVVNNAIVLIASIRRRVVEAGEVSFDIVVDSAAHRLRPIMLTTLCALAGMVVLYASGGPMWRPLAATIISGLVVSTLLVLFVLPVLYGAALSKFSRFS